MASRGSVEARRVGRRSMPICGLDIAKTGDCETSVDMSRALSRGQDACLAGDSQLRATQASRQEAGNAESVRWKFKLRPLASAQAVGTSARVPLMNGKGSLAPCGSAGTDATQWCRARCQSGEGHMTIAVARAIWKRQFSEAILAGRAARSVSPRRVRGCEGARPARAHLRTTINGLRGVSMGKRPLGLLAAPRWA
jgi:hypothetical protein